MRNAYEVADELADLGFAPYIPHSTHFWHLLFPRPYEFWLELDNQFFPHCNALIRIPGASDGADKEVAYAQSLGIPVFASLQELAVHFGVAKQDGEEK